MITEASTAHAVHYLFEWAGLGVGLLVYRAMRAGRGEQGLTAPGSFAVIVGALIGAAIGNKAVSWLDGPELLDPRALGLDLLLGGQSIVGALLGGWIGVEIGKRIAGIAVRTGDDLVAPILAGLAVGRVGCFLAGLHDGTCGLPTKMPWGVDFGDGIPRHPAQLYECLAALAALATWPWWRTAFAHTRGLAFRVLLLGYLLWRAVVDTLKPVPHAYALGLSGIQWLCIVAVVVIVSGLARDFRRTQHDQRISRY